MTDSFEVSRVIPAPAERIYHAWLDANQHAAMTGARASIEPDGHFTAWDGYIEGRTLETQPGRRILQAWRTTEFPPGSPDSKLEVVLEPQGDAGTNVIVRHSDLPAGQGASYEAGWIEHYFDPMAEYFGKHPLQQAAERVTDALEEAGERAGDAVEDLAATVKQAAKKVQAQARALVKKAKSRLKAKKAKQPKRKPAKAAKAKPAKAAKSAKAKGGSRKPAKAAKRPKKPARAAARKRR